MRVDKAMERPLIGYKVYVPVFRYQLHDLHMEGRALTEVEKDRALSYTVGRRYIIYVNPNKPEHFVLDRGLRFDAILLFGIGLFYLGMAAWLTW